MHFIDRDRRVQPVPARRGAPSRRCVAPFMLGGAAATRGGGGRAVFELLAPVGVGLARHHVAGIAMAQSRTCTACSGGQSPGMNSSQIPGGAQRRPSGADPAVPAGLKSPTTDTRAAFGAQTPEAHPRHALARFRQGPPAAGRPGCCCPSLRSHEQVVRRAVRAEKAYGVPEAEAYAVLAMHAQGDKVCRGRFCRPAWPVSNTPLPGPVRFAAAAGTGPPSFHGHLAGVRAVDSQPPALCRPRCRCRPRHLEWIVHAGFGKGKSGFWIDHLGKYTANFWSNFFPSNVECYFARQRHHAGPIDAKAEP